MQLGKKGPPLSTAWGERQNRHRRTPKRALLRSAFLPLIGILSTGLWSALSSSALWIPETKKREGKRSSERRWKSETEEKRERKERERESWGWGVGSFSNLNSRTDYDRFKGRMKAGWLCQKWDLGKSVFSWGSELWYPASTWGPLFLHQNGATTELMFLCFGTGNEPFMQFACFWGVSLSFSFWSKLSGWARLLTPVRI